MTKLITSSSLFLLLCCISFGHIPDSKVSGKAFTFHQNDTLNKFDTKGKKHGTWKVYLDEYTNPTDSANSFFIGFEDYEHGGFLRVFPRHSWKTKDSIAYSFDLPVK